MTRQMRQIMRQVKRFDRLRAMAKRAFRPKKRKRASNRVARARQTVYGHGHAVSDALRLA